MGRFVDVPPGHGGRLVVTVGDVLRVPAVGVVVESDAAVIENLGSFSDAVVGTDGSVHEPSGPPSWVLLRALEPGRADVSIRTAPAPWTPGGGSAVLVIEVRDLE